MTVGVLAEQANLERRVCVTPGAVGSLVRSGLSVVVETGAGVAAHFSDEDYRAFGARVVYDRDEVFGRCELVLKVSALRSADLLRVRSGTAVLAFHHLSATSRERVEGLMNRKVTLIGYEVLEDEKGDLPVLH